MQPREIMFLDLEVENHPYYGAIASPRHPENYVVMNGYAIESEPYKGVIQCDHYPTKEQVRPDWLRIPDSVWLLVMHNAPFEMDWFWVQQRPEILKFLKRGGRIFDTAYAEYLLSHQLITYPSLNETAPKYGGTTKIDAVKILWDQGKRTSEIDPILLGEYLAGPEGDVANTRLTFYGQYQKLVEQGMLNMAFERMEGLLYICLAMGSGLKVDREVAFTQLSEQEQQLDVLRQQFAQYRSHIPDYVKFNEGSDFHMSAWLFGGPIKYTGRVDRTNADGTPIYEKADFVKRVVDGTMLRLNDAGNIEYQNVDVMLESTPEVYAFDMHELERYKSGKNKGQIKVFREDTDVVAQKNADMLFHVAPLVDLSLLPKDILKEFKREFSGKRTLADDSPVYSTGKDCLDMLAERREFPEYVQALTKALKEFYKIDKDVGTYYLREEKDDNGVVKKQSGALQYLTPEGYIYHMLNATSTITTRLSSNRPNFQNLPRGGTSNVKKMFTSRFGNHGFIMEADYSALEVVTLAAFSKDKNLVKALLEGIDMHCLRLAKSLNEPYESVLEKCKNQEHPDFKRYDELRTAIKPKAFAYQYGATAQGIAFATGCTVEEAQKFIDTEKELFKEVEAFFDNVIFPEIERTKVIHREQNDAGNWQVYGRGYWQSPGGTCYSFRQYMTAKWAEGEKIEYMAFKPTQMRNYPIQGESGFFVQGISGKLARWAIANDFFPDENGNPRLYIINTVHDAFYFDVHYSILDIVGRAVKDIMESLPQHFNERFGYTLDVPFPAAVEFGQSMFHKNHWHEGVLNDNTVREKIGWPIIPVAQAA